MTYCEIYNEVYGNNKTLEDLCLTPAHAAAWNIIKDLDGRSGFDAWWDSIDDETKDEIFVRFVTHIRNSTLQV